MEQLEWGHWRHHRSAGSNSNNSSWIRKQSISNFQIWFWFCLVLVLFSLFYNNMLDCVRKTWQFDNFIQFHSQNQFFTTLKASTTSILRLLAKCQAFATPSKVNTLKQQPCTLHSKLSPPSTLFSNSLSQEGYIFAKGFTDEESQHPATCLLCSRLSTSPWSSNHQSPSCSLRCNRYCHVFQLQGSTFGLSISYWEETEDRGDYGRD